MKLRPGDPITARFYRRWGWWFLTACVALLFHWVGLPITGAALGVVALVALPFVWKLGARDLAEIKRQAGERRARGIGKLRNYLNRLKAENPQAYRVELANAYALAQGPGAEDLKQFLEAEFPLEDQ